MNLKLLLLRSSCYLYLPFGLCLSFVIHSMSAFFSSSSSSNSITTTVAAITAIILLVAQRGTYCLCTFLFLKFNWKISWTALIFVNICCHILPHFNKRHGQIKIHASFEKYMVEKSQLQRNFDSIELLK